MILCEVRVRAKFYAIWYCVSAARSSCYHYRKLNLGSHASQNKVAASKPHRCVRSQQLINVAHYGERKAIVEAEDWEGPYILRCRLARTLSFCFPLGLP